MTLTRPKITFWRVLFVFLMLAGAMFLSFTVAPTEEIKEKSEIETPKVEEAPKVGMRWRPEFIKGIGKRNGGFIIIPNMERIFEISGARTAPVAASEERSAS